jgi:hypothetical protein
MATRLLTVSDHSGEVIRDDADVVSVVVHDHPLLEGPVKLDASKRETEGLRGEAGEFVSLELISDGGDTTERVVLKLAAFDKLFNGNVDDVLGEAEKYRTVAPAAEPAPRRTRRTGEAKPDAEKVNYKEMPAAGQPHRGICTDEEKRVVRENLDEVNRLRVANGHDPIDPADDKMAARYGFDEQKVEDRPKLSPEFKS